jgi:high affinity Mn2+ porin
MKYVIGGGLEYALTGNWSARAEYFFLNQSLNTQVFDNGSNFQYYTRTRNETNIVRFGLNYNLGPQYEATGQSVSSDKRGADGVGLEERYTAHGQLTIVAQVYPKFPALYSGQNSFTPYGQARVGSTTNLFLGLRLWDGAGVFVNPEMNQGYGLSNSVGAAAYVNGAVAKVGSSAPYMRFQRYFLRQIIGLGGNGGGTDPDEGSRSEALESAQNQLAGRVDRDRLVLTLGKYSVGDVFDDNVYAHDPTTGFMNFAFNTMGAFDYAADAWGYTYGASLEWKQNWWTLRGGLFQLSTVPNGPEIEPVLGRQFMGVVETEGRYELFGQPGAIKFLVYGDNGYLSKFDQVTALAYVTGDFPPSIENLRKRRVKFGGGINLKQQIAPGLGAFMRASILDGRIETVDYTDNGRQLSMGLVAGGEVWDRAGDEVGAAISFGGLAGPQIRYFGAGGTSVYIGDGALTYGGEKATELYYKIGISEHADLTLDHQLLVNPGHNNARGPINVFGVRFRAGF